MDVDSDPLDDQHVMSTEDISYDESVSEIAPSNAGMQDHNTGIAIREASSTVTDDILLPDTSKNSDSVNDDRFPWLAAYKRMQDEERKVFGLKPLRHLIKGHE